MLTWLLSRVRFGVGLSLLDEPTQKTLTPLLKRAAEEKKALLTADGKRRESTCVAVNVTEDYERLRRSLSGRCWGQTRRRNLVKL